METTTAALRPMPTAQDAVQAAQIAENHELIDRVVYLASLASKFEEVDPMMDTLREVTASWDRAQPLQAAQEQKLHDLERNLKSYLINRDPLRAFTAETLQRRIEQRQQEGKMSVAARSSILIVLISVLAAAASYLPFLPISDRQFLAIPMFFVPLHIGIAWLYLTTLKNFNDEVRKAFKLVAIAVILFGLAFSQFVLTAAFPEHFEDSVVVTYIQTWLVAAPYLFIYFGMRMYANQLGIRTWVSKLPIIIAVWLVLVAVRILLSQDFTDPHFYGWAPAAISFTFFALISLLLVRQIRKVVTSAYAKPMAWMYAYLVVDVLASISANFPGDAEGEHIYILMVIFGVPVQLLLLMTGYSFKKELGK